MTLRFWFRRKAVILLQDKIPLLILLSVGAAFTAVWLALLRKRLNMAWYVAIMIAIAHTVYGVLTVKAFAFLETGFDKASLGNMSLFGGVFLMPLAYWLGAKFQRDRPRKSLMFLPPAWSLRSCAPESTAFCQAAAAGFRFRGQTGYASQRERRRSSFT